MIEGSSGAVNNININHPPPPTDLPTANHHRAMSRYRGVVRQSNCKWAAQIRVKEDEIRLGTFDSEDEAATAYDRGILKYRKPHKRGHLNILREEEIEEEIKFQAMYTKQEIVEMIKDHSYDEKLRRFNGDGHGGDINRDTEIMFSKKLTQTDLCQQLNIPKYHATHYFPLGEQQNTGKWLEFLDEEGKSWVIFYTCINNQRYALTAGWKDFMYHKKLKVGDLLLFKRLRSSNILTVIRDEEEEYHGQSVQLQGETSHVQSVQPQREISHVQSVHLQGETSHGQSVQPQRETSYGQSVQPRGETSHGLSVQLQGENSHGQSVQPQRETSHGQSVQPPGETSHCQSVQLQGENSHRKSVQPQGETSHGKSVQPQGETSRGQSVQPQVEIKNSSGKMHSKIGTSDARIR